MSSLGPVLAGGGGWTRVVLLLASSEPSIIHYKVRIITISGGGQISSPLPSVLQRYPKVKLESLLSTRTKPTLLLASLSSLANALNNDHHEIY